MEKSNQPSKKGTPTNDMDAARRQELGNFLNKRLAGSHETKNEELKQQAGRPNFIQALFDAAKREESQNIVQFDRNYIKGLETIILEIEKNLEGFEDAKHKKVKVN